jgi:predicted Zn-dependent protease
MKFCMKPWPGAWRGECAAVGRRAAALLALALAVGCQTGCQTVQTTRSGVVGVDRQQQMSPLVSTTQVDTEARQQYVAVLRESGQKGQLNRDAAETDRVRRIAQRLIAHTGVFRDDALRWQWEVNVIESAEVNAWCMPGGKIAVYTGLIDQLKITDDELAAVMGHEISHALREHARERMSRAAPVTLGAQVLGAVYGEGAADLGSLFGQAFFVLPNSRLNEQEADRIGVELAARAGYDPRAAVTLWKKMAALGGRGGTPQFLSTHPSPDSRIADLTQVSERVLPLYQEAQARR